ncbi:unnamed protein product [Didymodactylos carnosus]|uniref:Mab-21-like HhH/H2TH-like domain-containing protein n=1 Tax=Didymodactylos carnosus TaxID=1234261 RepID=A0A815I415_9BILA|nr:unnamed protein product [Didymodactylos carnosus]CAF4237340.1 unnamed protein product [Didymodactylos carnosus]
MHVIAKWSMKTSDKYKNVKFRYSFSTIEIVLAEQRPLVEQILNRVARGLYYKYLHKNYKTDDGKYLPSYFVKTTVLWMCETMDLDQMFTLATSNEKVLAVRLANKWIAHACSVMYSQNCLHYFIKNLNIIDEYPKEFLDKACHALQTEVNFSDDYITPLDIPPVSLSNDELFDKVSKCIDLWANPEFAQDSQQLCLELMGSTTIDNIYEEEDEMGGARWQSILAILSLAMYDTIEMNNWKKWKKLFLDDISSALPTLYSEGLGEQSKKSPLYIATLLMPLMLVK